MSNREREPRPGLPGAWDRFVGPGATKLESAGTVGATVLGARVGLNGDPFERSWGPLQCGAAALMGADLFGGVWANVTPAAIRWYHGRGQGTREMVTFSALHPHPFLVAALYRERDWNFALGNYAYLLVATAATSATPALLRRAVALALCCGGVCLNTAVWRPTPGLGWGSPPCSSSSCWRATRREEHHRRGSHCQRSSAPYTQTKIQAHQSVTEEPLSVSSSSSCVLHCAPLLDSPCAGDGRLF